MVGMVNTWYRRPKQLNVVEMEETAKLRKGPFTSDTVETRINWAKMSVRMEKTLYRRPKRLNVVKRKKRLCHPQRRGDVAKM